MSGLALLVVLSGMVQDMLGSVRYTYTPPWTTHELTKVALLAMTGCGTLIGLAILRIFAVRRIVVGAMLVCVGLPVVVILIVVAAFYALFYAPNRANGTIVCSGGEREYLLYVPSSYDRSKPTPLVISMHAAAMWPGAQMEISQWNSVADEHGFIVVYPSGTTLDGVVGTGVWPKVWLLRRDADLSANVTFISELIDKLAAAYNIDPTRIYANGYSNGGAMAFALSCALSHRIAAVGTVSAAQDQRDASWCADSPPMPLINFHGTADLVPYGGGRVFASPRPFPSVTTWTADWARRNRCAPDPIESVVAPDVARLEYANCSDGANVVLYTIRGGGHTWPGGKPMPEWLIGHTSRSIDATSQMWAFFREHRLPEHVASPRDRRTHRALEGGRLTTG
jgi:polyhydroxybutyrate depolymerase